MQPLTLAGLFIAVAALSAVVYFQPGTRPSVSTSPVLVINTDAVEKIRLQSRKDTMLFSRQHGQWHMTSPVSAPAIQDHVQALIQIATLHSTTSYSLTGLDLKQFGLEKPLNRLRIDGHTLLFGGMNPIGNMRYVASGSTLHLVDTALTGLLFKPYTYFLENPDESEVPY